jgi:acetate---CoA ligase (ADP-forming)
VARPAVQPVDVALRDGSTVRVRRVRGEDVDGLRALLAGMSDNARWLRFLSAGANLDRAAAMGADPGDGAGLVVTIGAPERIVAHAMFARESGERAELAFEVADEWHGRGIATILLAHLAGVAARAGVTTFVAYVHPSNRRMIGVFRESGFPVEVRSSAGELEVVMPAELGEAARARFEDRGRAAAAAAVAHVLRPSSVVLVTIGGTAIGATVMRNLHAAGYAGDLRVLVTPIGDAAVPPADLAILSVPPAEVLEHAEVCGDAGVRALLVLTGGFLDGGEEGGARLSELLAVCRRSGMRLVGPSSLGVLDLDPAVRLNATAVPVVTRPGPVAFASQSGAIGVAAMAEAARRGIGLSSFVSTGDKADLSGNDFLQYWERDPATRVVLLYLESFGNPRRFGTIARRVAGAKPIVVVKSGRRAAAPGPGATRTRALLSASDVSVDALFEHAGVIRTETVFEQLDVASLLATQPLPRGDRVGIVSNGRGPALSCADACTAAGLDPQPPVDLGATATAAEYASAIERMAADVEALVAVFVPALATEAGAVAKMLGDTRVGDTTLMGAFMAHAEDELAALASGPVPLYRSPVEAARALSRVAGYARWRARPAGDRAELDGVDQDAAAAVIAAALTRGEGGLHLDEVQALLAAYGILYDESGPQMGGVEMVAGVLGDPDFGPVVVCGLGGPTAELLGDAAVRLAPLSRADAAGLLRSLRSFPVLDGYRGAPPADVDALEDLLVRLSALADAHPEVTEVDCDPVLVLSAGALVAGARIRVAPAGPTRPFPALDR